MLIATLVLFLIISIGSVSANEDVADDSVLKDANNVDNAISESIASDDVAKANEKDEKPISAAPIEIADGASNDDIQTTFNGLKDNDVVNFAKNGKYENIKLIITNQTPNTRLKNITLNGNGATLKGTLKTTMNSSYYDGLFEIQNVDGFTITGFNFIAEGVTQANMKTPSCVIVYNTKNGVIENNNISGGRFGLYVGSKFDKPNFDTIIRNNIVRNVTDGGIISFGSARSVIVNNTIINPANHGIDVRHGQGPNCVVQGNTIIGAKEAIYLMHSSGHKAIDNKIYNSEIGITCYGSSNIFCDHNAFLNKTKIGYLLSNGYSNITIGENNNYTGLAFTPMPPTFQYYVVKADAEYNNNKSGVFTQHHTPYESSITANDVTTTTKTSKTIAVTLKDDEGKAISNKVIKVSVNGKESTITTDANGVANIVVNYNDAGVYYYTLTFLGDDDYKASVKTVKATVNKQTTKATMPAKKYKAKKTKKVTFTLKDASGKAIKGKTITFTVKGKKYTAKTNAKGIATVKVKLTKKGKYTVTAKFAGDSTYKAVSKKAKLTITK